MDRTKDVLRPLREPKVSKSFCVHHGGEVLVLVALSFQDPFTSVFNRVDAGLDPHAAGTFSIHLFVKVHVRRVLEVVSLTLDLGQSVEAVELLVDSLQPGVVQLLDALGPLVVSCLIFLSFI